MSRAKDEPASFRGTGVYAGLIVAFLIALALVLLIAQNRQAVTVGWLVWDFTASLAASLIVTAFLSSLLSVLVGVAWRRRRRRTLSQRQELMILRAEKRTDDADTDADSRPAPKRPDTPSPRG